MRIRVASGAGTFLILASLVAAGAAADEQSSAILAKFNGLWVGTDKLAGAQVSLAEAETDEPSVGMTLPGIDDILEPECHPQGIVLNCQGDGRVTRLEPRTDGTLMLWSLDASTGTTIEGFLSRESAAETAPE